MYCISIHTSALSGACLLNLVLLVDASFGDGFDSFNITKTVDGELRLVQSGRIDADSEWGNVHVCDC